MVMGRGGFVPVVRWVWDGVSFGVGGGWVGGRCFGVGVWVSKGRKSLG